MRKSLLGLLKRDKSRSRSPSVLREPSRPLGEEDERESQPPEPEPEPELGPGAAPPATEAVCDASDNVSEDLWSRALGALSQREPELVQDYGLHVAARQDNQATTDAAGQPLLSNPESLKKAVQTLQDQRETKQWRFTVKGKSHKTKDQVEKLVKLLSFADGVVKQATSAQPYAALAWSAVSLFIPLVSASFSKETAMVQGFTTIADLQLYWKNCEDVYLKSTHSPQYQGLNEPLCNLYSYMLEYQVRAICHLSKKQLSRAWDKLSAQDDWASRESNIIKLSEKCNAHIGPLEKREIRQASEEKMHQIQGFIGQAVVDIVDAMKDENQKEKERGFMQNLKKVAGYYKQGMEFNKDPVKGTCEWFYQSEDFSSWVTSEDSGVFWVTAGPGCGKSVLARSLVKNGHLQSTTTTVHIDLDTRVQRREDTVCYFFFKDESAQRMSASTAICAILHQLFNQDPTGDLIKQALDQSHGDTDPSGLDFNELWDILVLASESSTSGQIICVLDALDECTAYDRGQLMTQLDRFYKEEKSSPINLKFLITSRPYDDIELSFKPLLQRTQYFRFDADERHKEISHDIGLVIEAKIDTLASDLSEADRRRIVEALKSRGTKTYLWLHLTLELMQGHPSNYSRQRDVDALIASVPTKVADAYEKTLNRSESEQKTSALLQIMLAARQPLTLDEANYALTLATADIEIETHAKLDEERWKGDFKSIVKNFCGLLVSVYDGKLSFIHLTAREFLLEKLELRSGTAAAAGWRGRFADSAVLHRMLTRCCMQYLLLSDFVFPYILPVGGKDIKYGLLSYAALRWVEHFHELDEAGQSIYLPKARQLCSTSLPPLRTWGGLYVRFSRGIGYMYRDFYGWSDLAVASFVGLQPLVEDLVENVGADVNELCRGYGTALHAAVARDRESIAAYLISKGAEMDVQPNGREGTPLDVAVSLRQHHGIVKLLLANGASPLKACKYGNFIATRSERRGRAFAFSRDRSATILACAAMLPDKDSFYTMLATLMDIGSPEAILLSAADQRIIDGGDMCRAVLLGRLDDEILASGEVLTESLLPVLLSVTDVGHRVLRLLKQQNRQSLLISRPILDAMVNMPNVDELLVEHLAETEEPCASITQDVLEIVAQYYEPDTLRAFIQFSPKNSCTIKKLILRAVLSEHHCYTAPLVVLEFARAEICADEQLQRELLETSSGIGESTIAIVYVFLEMPLLIPPVKKMLPTMVLKCYNNPKDMGALLLRVLERCDDQDVIDSNLLALAASHADARAVKMLLDRHSGLSMADEYYLKATARNFRKGKEVMQFLLDKYGAEAAVTPHVVRIACEWNNRMVGFLLETCPEQVPITADIVSRLYTEESLKLVLQHKRDELAQMASQVLRMVVAPRRNPGFAMEILLKCCPLSWFEPSEAVILNLLEGDNRGTIGRISLLINKLGDKIVITEPVLAAVAAATSLIGNEVADIFKIWKPDQFKVTPWIVEKTAACGSTHGLDYLIRASDGALTVEDKWYRLARFRGTIAYRSYRGFKEDWNDDALDLNMPDVYGKTALHVAADMGNLPLVRFLLEDARANVHATDRRGWTALHFAVDRVNIELVQTLLAAGAEPYQADLEGDTPVSIAADKAAMSFDNAYLETMLWILQDEWYAGFMAPRFGMDDEEDDLLE